ncbi:MAG: MxaD, partial [Pseudomonadota bacterium]
MTKDAVAAIKNDAVAVIGMSCRLPGKSNSPGQFWDFLMNEGDGIVDVPADRWDAQAYFDADPAVPNKMYVKRGGFIEQIDQFDPQFFGISPKEAPHIDPQHRWLLELAYEAMENAGLKAGELKGSDTAVFIGQFMHDYEQIQLDPRARGEIASHSATGPSMTLTANRISYCFDFNGPSVTLDTACSSSLVALDMACKAILNGDSQLAIAGGVNILLRPELTMSICKASMLSPDMQCKSFDAAANGYVRSEGAALVMLKSLAQAQADGDPILAVIRATGINQDGQTAGITVPSGAAQQMLLKKTLKLAGFDSADIQYAEAHGTGTAVGDPIEVNALGATLGQRPQDATPCVIGSVKSNIGHTEATAGAAALIKTIMAMNHGVIPKNIHLNNVNPAIDLQALNVRLAAQHQPWPDVPGQTRKAIVNSFGFGGTNANAVLEQAPARSKTSASYGADSYFWLPLSGKSEKSLQDNAANYLAFLNQTDANLADIAYSAATKREHFRFRAVVSGHTLEEMQQGLADLAANRPGNLHVQGKVLSEIKGRRCFVFSGMGTTWAGMGKKLYETEAVFRAALDRCDAALRPLTGWSLVEHMLQTEDQEKVHQTNIAQPAIFASQVALAELLASQGVVPEAIVGHSAGEVAASYIAGVLSFDDAITVIYHRSRLQHTTEGMGKMLAVALTEAALQPYLAGQEHKVSIAAINSDDALTLSGDADVLQHIANQLDEQGIFARFLKVAVPYHSPVMDSL